MSETGFSNKNGHFIRTWEWKSREQAKGAIFLLHGYAEYGGRYKPIASFFNEAGFDVFAFDHQGHGQSYGKHGLISDWKLMVSDAVEAFNYFTSKYPDHKPWFMLGHSMGGGLAALLSVQLQSKLSGMLLSAPLIDDATNTPGFLKSIGKAIAAVAPSLGMISFDQSGQSRDPDVMKLFRNDDLNYKGKLRAGTGAQILDMIESIRQIPGKITLPIWIGHSSIDRLTSFEASKNFHSNLASADKTFRKYDGLFHEIMNEPERRIVLEEMAIWIKKRL